MRHLYLLYFFITLCSFTVYGKKVNIHGMKAALHNVKENSGKVEQLYRLAWELRKINQDSAIHYGTKALELAEKINDRKGLIKSYTTLGVIYKNLGEYKRSLALYNKGIQLAKLNDDQESVSKLYNNIGIVYKLQGTFDLAVEYYKKSIEIKRREGESKELSNPINNLGIIYAIQGNYDEALRCHLEALEIRKLINDYDLITQSYNNIGSMYMSKKLYEKARGYFNKALVISDSIGNRNGKAKVYNNLGIMYKNQKEFSNSIASFQKALDIYEEVGQKNKIALTFLNIGESYNEVNKEMALRFILKGMKIAEGINHKDLILKSYLALGLNYNKQGKYNEAIEFLKSSIALSKEIKSLSDESYARKSLSESYKLIGESKLAYDELLIHSEVERKIYNQEVAKNAERMEAVFQNGKLENKITELNVEQEIANRKRFLQWVVFGIAIVSALFISIAVYRSMKMKKRHLAVVEAQKLKVEEQRDLISNKNIEITSSIRYAKKIQEAVLTVPLILKEFVGDYFVLFQPKDIVSGDFYWSHKKDNKIFFSAADCTGHGVPGAMVSVVCINALVKVVQELGIIHPSKILDATSEIVERSFEKGADAENSEGIADGMDLSLCSIDIETKVLEYSGANNSIYVVKSKNSSLYNEMEIEANLETDDYGLFELKADSQPIGKYFARKPFNHYSVQLEKGDAIYSFTDGYADQFGGPKGKKYKYKPFKKFILSLQDYKLAKQHKLMLDEFTQWKGDEEQIDDVCIMAVRLS